jgi:hypothetical protein
MKSSNTITKRMKTLLGRMALASVVFGLAGCVGSTRSGVAVGTSGPLTAFRAEAPLGWSFQIRNDSEVTHKALYSINGRPALKVVPARGTVKAGYVLGSETPTFNFAPPFSP